MPERRTERIAPGTWAIDDPGENSMYLLEGDERAFLIDTGLDPAPLMPLLRSLTGKPIDLLLTHAHIDHMYHCGLFDRLYIHEDDLKAWHRPLKQLFCAGCLFYHVPFKRPPDLSRAIPLKDGSAPDPGGRPLRVIHAPGHTPGSVIYADDRRRLLFTGDAFGSGEAVWMWLPGCMRVRDYRDSLRSFLEKLEPCADYRFFGGHRLQGVQSERHPHGHPLTIRVPRDMLSLCDEMLSGRAVGKRVRLVPGIPMNVYSLGEAGMVQRRSRIR